MFTYLVKVKEHQNVIISTKKLKNEFLKILFFFFTSKSVCNNSETIRKAPGWVEALRNEQKHMIFNFFFLENLYPINNTTLGWNILDIINTSCRKALKSFSDNCCLTGTLTATFDAVLKTFFFSRWFVFLLLFLYIYQHTLYQMNLFPKNHVLHQI